MPRVFLQGTGALDLAIYLRSRISTGASKGQGRSRTLCALANPTHSSASAVPGVSTPLQARPSLPDALPGSAVQNLSDKEWRSWR